MRFGRDAWRDQKLPYPALRPLEVDTEMARRMERDGQALPFRFDLSPLTDDGAPLVRRAGAPGAQTSAMVGNDVQRPWSSIEARRPTPEERFEKLCGLVAQELRRGIEAHEVEKSAREALRMLESFKQNLRDRPRHF